MHGHRQTVGRAGGVCQGVLSQISFRAGQISRKLHLPPLNPMEGGIASAGM
jgi:hypothetical protein